MFQRAFPAGRGHESEQCLKVKLRYEKRGQGSTALVTVDICVGNKAGRRKRNNFYSGKIEGKKSMKDISMICGLSCFILLLRQGRRISILFKISECNL